MLQRCVVVVLFATLLLAAARGPQPVAPDTLAHVNALFLRSLTGDGKRRVEFNAAATGTHFFLEEAAGVTVYAYTGSDYKKVEFLKGSTLAKAMKKYATK
jgi:hypothetical protein